MFARRNHILTLRERSAAVVHAPLPAEMLSLVLNRAATGTQRHPTHLAHNDSLLALMRLSKLPTEVYRARASASVYPTV